MMAATLPAITFVSDEDVLDHIVDVSTGGSIQRGACILDKNCLKSVIDMFECCTLPVSHDERK